MKVLDTEAQTSLRNLLGAISHQDDTEVQAQINYWKIELKPKRVRRLPKNPLDNPVEV